MTAEAAVTVVATVAVPAATAPTVAVPVATAAAAPRAVVLPAAGRVVALVVAVPGDDPLVGPSVEAARAGVTTVTPARSTTVSGAAGPGSPRVPPSCPSPASPRA